MEVNRLIVVISFVFILICSNSITLFAQKNDYWLRGKIIDDKDSSAIAHATIIVEGIKNVYVAKTDGSFIVPVKDNSSFNVKISKVGYTTMVLPLTPSPKISIIRLVATDNILEEVTVNTGYQQIPKERATGSFEFVDTELFNRQIGTDVLSRLDGVLASAMFDKRQGSEQNIIVRGVSTLGLDEDRGILIVVDNFPFEGDINTINPNDVESIVLLKDAAASSIWGARAGNGVLVITTKKGRFNSPWTATMSVNNAIFDRPDLYYLPRMTTGDFIDIEEFLYNKGVFNSILSNEINYPVVTPVVELLRSHTDGEMTDVELRDRLGELRNVDVRDDLHRYFYRTGINQQYAVNLNGGGEKYNSRFSVGYDQNNGTSIGNSLQRVNININNIFNILPQLDLRIGARYGMLLQRDNQMGDIQISPAQSIYPYAKLVGKDGEALIIPKDYRPSYLDGVEQRGHLLDWRYRPYEELNNADNTSRSTNIVFDAGVSYRMFSGLEAELQYQYQYEPNVIERLYDESTYYTRNMINRFTKIDGNDVIRQVPLGGIFDRSTSELQAHSARAQLGYGREWSDHSLTAIAGGEIRHSGVEGNSTRLFGYNDELLTSTPVDYINRLPIYDNLAEPTNIAYADRAFGRVQRFVSIYGNGNYTFRKKYILSFSARKDASNIFGVETNNKWSPLWSIGGVWNIAEENFYAITALPRLKLRATYGYSGNIRNDIAAVTTLSYQGISRLGRYPYAIVQNPPNPSLRWERVATWNLGLDFGLFNNRLSGSIEYYRKTSTDLISPVSSDPTTGFNSLRMNSAVIRNTGVDINLNGRIKVGNISWLTNVLVSVNKNRVQTYLREPTRFSQWVGTGLAISPIEGEPAYPLVSYRWGGLDGSTGDPIGYIDGIESKDYTQIYQHANQQDLVFHGSALPEMYGAFRNTFNWRELSVSFNITYRTGYYFRRNTVNYSNLLNATPQVGHADFDKRWQKPGDEIVTTVPSMIYPANNRRDDFYRYAEPTAERGDHIRLQDINITYAFGRKDKSVPFRDFKATLYARNLGIIWRSNKFHLDPDVTQYPLPKTLALGLTVNF